MSSWSQAWLSGASGADEDPSGNAERPYRGERLGFPETGPGSVASFGQRVLALVVDWLPCSVAAQLFTDNPAFSALALFAALTVVTVSVWGRTPGHAALGLRVAGLDGRPAGFGAAVIRTVLICLLVPPLVSDIDGRGLHDKAAGTVVLRSR